MTDIPQIQGGGPSHWKLALPDWQSIDSIRKDQLPFALWAVGEQALLFHWLDAAVDQGTEKVEFFVTDRPLEIRQRIRDASLWPIEIEVRTVTSIDDSRVDDYVNRLPGTPRLESDPTDGWELIKHWFHLEQEWLKNFAKETKQYGPFAAVGKSCEIAEQVRLTPPYWIGNHVSIGPDSSIGPGVVIEDGCVLAGAHEIKNARIGAHTYLAPHTELNQAALHGNTLFNFKHQARVSGLEAFLASGVNVTGRFVGSRPNIRERWLALRLYLKWAKLGVSSDTEFRDLHGENRPVLQDDSPRARGPWLKKVVAGKMALFGLTPRPESSISNLPLEWQEIFRKAPVGAFSYADVIGTHDIGSEEEVMHCIYQASAQDTHCRDLFDKWVRNLT